MKKFIFACFVAISGLLASCQEPEEIFCDPTAILISQADEPITLLGENNSYLIVSKNAYPRNIFSYLTLSDDHKQIVGFSKDIKLPQAIIYSIKVGEKVYDLNEEDQDILWDLERYQHDDMTGDLIIEGNKKYFYDDYTFIFSQALIDELIERAK